MYLRSKQTGKKIEVISIHYLEGDPAISVLYRTEDGYLDGYAFNSLDELNSAFEDYKPVEPLIKDEKIRKAVRAWAEAGGINGCTFDEFWGALFDEFWEAFRFDNRTIGFKSKYLCGELLEGLEDGRYYTIAELCGEEK